MLLLRTMVTVPVLCALLAFAPAAMATRYAAPAGTNVDPCTFAQPCSLTTAINGATAMDNVVRLFGGTLPGAAGDGADAGAERHRR